MPKKKKKGGGGGGGAAQQGGGAGPDAGAAADGEDVWNEVDRLMDHHLQATARVAELWADMDELVVQRDRWHAQFKSTQVASDTALDPRTRMDPKTTTQAARQEEGRAIAQLGRQYSVHQRKLHKLNDQVIAKTREIMDLEERYNVKGQQQVSEAMKAAVRDDNPEHVLRLLGKPAATRTDTATGGAGLMRSST